jgi:hypothetical protein
MITYTLLYIMTAVNQFLDRLGAAYALGLGRRILHGLHPRALGQRVTGLALEVYPLLLLVLVYLQIKWGDVREYLREFAAAVHFGANLLIYTIYQRETRVSRHTRVLYALLTSETGQMDVTPIVQRFYVVGAGDRAQISGIKLKKWIHVTTSVNAGTLEILTENRGDLYSLAINLGDLTHTADGAGSGSGSGAEYIGFSPVVAEQLGCAPIYTFAPRP